MRTQWIVLLAVLCSPGVFADQTVINNYGTNSPAPSVNCQGNQSDNGNEQQIGTYSYHTPTTSGTIVTTGTKHPDLPNNCNNTPIIQPYVYAQPPGPGPGPRH